jgi:tetratricopeptide (TPR) repeat protein
MHWRYYSALALERAGESEKAISAYERVLELDSNHGPSYVKLAGLLVESDRQRAALLCKRALELDPKDPGAILGLGLCAAAAGEHQAALAHAQRALDIVPNYGAAHLAMARALAALRREPEAAQHRAAAKHGITPLVNDNLLEALLRNGLHRDTLIQDALLLGRRGFFDEAERALAMAREVDPAGTAIHGATGRLRAMQGRLEGAAREFRFALEAKPELSESRADLAGVLARLGNRAKAESELRAALKQSPDSTYVLERYVRLLMDLERPEEAENLLWKAAARQPADSRIRLLLANLLLEVNQDDEARRQFEAVLEMAPNNADARYSLAVLAQRAGDLAGARKQWEQIVQSTPTFLSARMALAEAAMQERDFATAERHLREALKQSRHDAGVASALAWILATSPSESQRDGEEAVWLAEKACKLTQRSQHAYLDTLAAAYAERGRFDDAVTTARDAVRLAKGKQDPEAAAAYQHRLTLYEKQQPYHQAD